MHSFAPQITILALMQGLFLTNNVTLIAINGLAGFSLTSHKILATLPVTCYLLGSALMTVPASRFMKKHGRAAGYKVGAIAAFIGSLLAYWAMVSQSLTLLCTATLVLGAFPGFSSTLRFTAAEVSDALKPTFKSRAISWAAS
jgi:fucose permease